MTIAIVNGPNLNMLGRRDQNIYGSFTLSDIMNMLRLKMPGINFIHFQSNQEGDIIDFIQKVATDPSVDGMVINPGAYAHYSYAIADALRDLQGKPVVEVHISNIHAREEFRQHSVTAPCVNAVIAGAGENGYLLAVHQIIYILEMSNIPY